MSRMDFIRRMVLLAGMVLGFVLPGVLLEWLLSGRQSVMDAIGAFFTSPLLWLAVVVFWFVAGVLALVVFFRRNSLSAWEDDRLG